MLIEIAELSSSGAKTHVTYIDDPSKLVTALEFLDGWEYKIRTLSESEERVYTRSKSWN